MDAKNLLLALRQFCDGAPERPLSLDQLAAKYRDCAARLLDSTSVERSLELVLGLEGLESITPLSELLLAPAAAATT